MARKKSPYPLRIRLKELVELKEKRDGRKYSYRDIAEETNLALGTIRTWMNDYVDRYDKNTLASLLQWLGVTPNVFFGFEEPSEEGKIVA